MNAVLIPACIFFTGALMLATVEPYETFHQYINESKAVEAIKNPKKLICFYVFTKNFNAEIMDGLCTHINVGFFGISKTNHSLEILNEQEEMLSQVMLLKKNSSDLKIILSVGGAGVVGFSEMVANHTNRKTFIRSCMQALKKFKADGLDLDWEWPVISDGDMKEKVKFVQLLREIRNEFDRHKKKYILSADVSSIRAVIELGYYVNYIADFVDFVNVMCYDYHFFTKYYPFTGHNAPLYSSGVNILSKDINQSVTFWYDNSMPREKIVVGVPTYGHSFELVFSHLHALVAPAKGVGSVGLNGFADYRQICEFLKQKDTIVVYDEVSKVPYAYRYPDWISYDDEKSLAIKASYVLDQNLGGIMIFSVNADDYDGSCRGDGVSLPLIRKVRNILFNEV